MHLKDESIVTIFTVQVADFYGIVTNHADYALFETNSNL